MLDELRKCRTIHDLAEILDIPPKTLTYLLYILPDQKKYSTKCISKKSGGTRQLQIPEARLKRLQRNLGDLLYRCQIELDEKYKPRRSFGFEKQKSIYDNAISHNNKRWVFNIDIEEFFPSINFGRVISFFKYNKDFSLYPIIATYIAQIACFKNELPQGSPCSPVISNLICGSLDFRLSKIAAANLCNFSRYADDITFSTNQRSFPASLAVQDQSSLDWKASHDICTLIAESGFFVNHWKTRMSTRDSRQMVTGLVVNHKPNVPREYYKKTRAAIHNLLNSNSFYINNFCTPFGNNCEDEKKLIDSFSSLEGRISHCFSVNDRNDKRSEKEKFFKPTAIAKSYADLLLFKYFIRGTRPIILTEGPSDIIYLKAALKKSSKSIPGLLELNKDGSRKIITDFYKFPEQGKRLLGISGGSGNISLFIERYYKFLKRLNSSVPRRPFIILLDNDDGISKLKKNVKDFFKVDISMEIDKNYYQLSNGFYIVKTPHLPKISKTCVEDFLDQTAISTPLNGKTFSPDSDDVNLHFGKMILAKRIYNDHSKYSFSEFEQILNRLSEASQLP